MRQILLAVLLAGPAFAQPAYDLRDDDVRFDIAALTERLSGNTVTFFDDGQSEYYTDGRYTYTYANDGGTAYGYWRIESDTQVCIDYVNGFSRCDLYVTNGDRMILLDERGERYPVRP